MDTTNGATLSACGGASNCSAISDEVECLYLGHSAQQEMRVITAALVPGSTVRLSQSVHSAGYVFVFGYWSCDAFLWIASGGRQHAAYGSGGKSGTPKSGSHCELRRSCKLGTVQFPGAGHRQHGLRVGHAYLDKPQHRRATQRLCGAGKQSLPKYRRKSSRSQHVDLQRWPGGTSCRPCGVSTLTVRVIDSSTPPNSVLGASVCFQSTVQRRYRE